MGYALIVLASFLWGGSSSLGKRLMTAGLPTAMLMELRTVVAAVVLMAGLAVLRPRLLRVTRYDLARLAALAIPALTVVNLSYYIAIRHLPVATAVFIQFTAPVLVFAWDVVTGHVRPTTLTVTALALAIGGVYLMVGASVGGVVALPAIGLAAAAVSSLSSALYTVLSHRLTRRLESWTVAGYAVAISAVFWCVLQSPRETVERLVALDLVWPGLAFACTAMVLPTPIYLAGLRRVTATGGAIAATSETIAASAVAWMVLGEPLAPGQLLGGSCIVAAVVLLATARG